jgi:beta-mannosidase
MSTGLRAGAVSSTRTSPLDRGWTLTSTEPGAVADVGSLRDAPLEWTTAVVPGTVAQAVGPDDLDAHADYDARDWWYRGAFSAPAAADGARVRLRFDGLATLAEVWLNGVRVLESNNMFLGTSVDVTDLLAARNELVIAFRSLAASLTRKRPRPRWKTRLVEQQQLRWHRTTLLGRIPGWTPRIPPVGPWRPIWLEVVEGPDLAYLDVRPRIDEGAGVVHVDGLSAGPRIERATLTVGSSTFPLGVEHGPDGTRILGEARLAGVALWWPRTHGEPALHSCSLSLRTASGTTTVDLRRIGFRDIRVDTTGGNVRFLVNGVPVFCRGACWTNNDVVSLVGSEARMRRTLELTAAAHANMVRVGGTMVYETDAFYDTCDELGVMVWQDLMFANMDYPVDDAEFRSGVEAEVEYQLRRLQRHPSIAAVCGGSEVEQQAAMFGAAREVWTNDFFSGSAPRRVAEVLGDPTPYWPSTPTGGPLPFHVGSGIAHYFGVGAYLRPLDDARTAGVRFSPECLGFSNVPGAEGVRDVPGGGAPGSEAAWKRGVPRDSGTTWDFEDVRDHYLALLHGVDPVELRSGDLARYLALSSSVTGRVMASVFGEWRSPENPCSGGLVWFLQDLRPGAGWGIIDRANRPKPVYHHLKRAWAPVCVTLLDRGLDGLRVEVHNEAATLVAGVLEITVLGLGSVPTARASTPIAVPPRDAVARSVDALIGHFTDSTYAYRFGPLGHAAVVARWRPASGTGDVTAIRWSALDAPLAPTDLTASVDHRGSGATLTVHAAKLARDVRVECPGWAPAEDALDLEPGETRAVALVPNGVADKLRGHVEASNLVGFVTFSADRPTP